MPQAIGGVSTQLIATFGMIVMALSVIFIRMKAAKKPTSIKKIIIPPLGMSTGFLMFAAPVMRIPLVWALGAFVVGAIFFSYPLIKTSNFYVSGRKVYLERSKAFIVILLVLLCVRLILHSYLERFITIPQTGSVFFILAFGMLLPWRIAMYVQYKQISKSIPEPKKLDENPQPTTNP